MRKEIILISVLIALILAGCSNGSITGEAIAQPEAEPDVEILIEASQFDFEPRTITVKTGQRVRLTLHSRNVAHGIEISDIGVHVGAAGGESASVDFTAPAPGEYPFECNVFCGRGHRGMTGMLVVTE